MIVLVWRKYKRWKRNREFRSILEELKHIDPRKEDYTQSILSNIERFETFRKKD